MVFLPPCWVFYCIKLKYYKGQIPKIIIVSKTKNYYARLIDMACKPKIN